MSYIDHNVINGQTYYLRDKDALHKDDWIDTVFPVGFIYMTMNPEDPSDYLGGSWVLWGQGRVPICVDVDDSDFNTADKIGGRKDAVIPKHKHSATFAGFPMATHKHTAQPHMHYAYGKYDFVIANELVYGDAGSGLSGTGKVYPYVPKGSRFDITSESAKTTVAIDAVSAGTPAGSVAVSDTGQANVSNANLQPYITCYMWRRVQ